MKKQDVYEHLANVYLDVPLRSRDKKDPVSDGYKKKIHTDRTYFFVAFIVLIIGFSFFLFALNRLKEKEGPLNSENIFVLQPEAVKIEYNFEAGKKQIHSINFKKTDLSRFSKLGFSVRKTEASDQISLRVEFVNSYKESAFVYVRDISTSWKKFSLGFSDFRELTDWTEVVSLSFIVEEWNARNKEGAIYIDNVALTK